RRGGRRNTGETPMILHWERLAQFYGTELHRDRWRFEAAHQSTYALLCCRLARGDDLVRASAGDHAEARLVETDLWEEDIPRALDPEVRFAGADGSRLGAVRPPGRSQLSARGNELCQNLAQLGLRGITYLD